MCLFIFSTECKCWGIGGRENELDMLVRSYDFCDTFLVPVFWIDNNWPCWRPSGLCGFGCNYGYPGNIIMHLLCNACERWEKLSTSSIVECCNGTIHWNGRAHKRYLSYSGHLYWNKLFFRIIKISSLKYSKVLIHLKHLIICWNFLQYELCNWRLNAKISTEQLSMTHSILQDYFVVCLERYLFSCSTHAIL